ncbi:MAG: hypothetical protein AAGA48_05135 [Myxococcota bacterium]
MVVAWWVGTALAAAPEGVDIEAVEVWQGRAADLRKGPKACWRLSGKAETHVAVFRPPTVFGRASQTDYVFEGTFSGTFEDGNWTAFTADMKPTSKAAQNSEEEDVGIDWDVPVRPLVGRAPEDASSQRRRGDDTSQDDEAASASGTREAITMLDTILDAVDADVTTTYAQWSDEPPGVELFEEYPIKDGSGRKTVDLRTFFPNGDAVPASLDVTFPKRHRIKASPVRITLLRPQLHIRTQNIDGEAVPIYESVSLAGGALGFTVGFEQVLQYERATACEAPAPEVESESDTPSQPEP